MLHTIIIMVYWGKNNMKQKRNKKLLGIVFCIMVIVSGSASAGHLSNNTRIKDNVENYILLEKEPYSALLNLDGNTLYVGGSGPGNYTKIQDAIDNASDGDTIFVYSGTYNERVFINKSIDLIGENRSNTIIDGGGSRDVVKIVASWVSVQNFYLNNSGQFYGNSGIKIYREINNITIQNNIIKNNLIGICIGDVHFYHKIIHVTIVNNLIQNRRYGVMLNVGYETTISNNTFIDNGLLITKGYTRDNTVLNNTVNGRPLIYFEQQSNKIIEPNVGQIILVMCDNITVSDQCLDKVCEVGIELFVCSNCNIIKNSISNKSWGIFSLYSEYNNIQNNFMENVSLGIYLDNSDRHTISFNKINNSLDAINIVDSNHNTISYNTMTNSRKGLALLYSNDNKILNNVINSCRDHGIDLFFSCNRNQFLNNTIKNCLDAGIYILGTSRIWWDQASIKNVISGNNLKNNKWGILLEEAALTTVSSNNIFQNYYGIEVISAKYNRIFNNNIFENKEEDAFFKNSFSSRFDSNYWNETKRLHIIKGGIYRYNYWTESYILILPLIRFDWHPAQEPYDIGV